jgi:serine phosphatase RsbU (regulator of sigma subunit)
MRPIHPGYAWPVPAALESPGPARSPTLPNAPAERPRRRFGIRWRIALLTLMTALAASGLIAWMGYRAENAAAMRGVDDQLRAIAVAVPDVLPDGYHARMLSGHVSMQDYQAQVGRLTGAAAQAGVYYLYTCIERDGLILFASTSASPEERADGSWSPMLDEYDEPPIELKKTLEDGEPRFASYTDEFGSFRSIFLRSEDPAGGGSARFVVGADVRLDRLQAIAAANLRRYIAAALGVAAAVGAAGMLAGRRISRPIAKLTLELGAFADEDFTGDRESVAEVRRLSLGGRSETAELARTFLDMRRRLRARIAQLTRVTEDKQRIESQLAIARQIQRGLLPSEPPPAPGFDIAGWSEAADEAGGDFYDWIAMADGRVIVSIADVTGHGIGPAIMAAVCRAYARATLTEDGSLEDLVSHLNHLLLSDTSNGQFVTFFVGVLDPAHRRMRVLSAGHGPVLLRRAATGQTETLVTHAAPLGILDELAPDPVTEFAFEPGDILLLVSDGFFEWAGRAGEQFGTRRLSESLERAAGRSSADVIESIRADVAAHTTGTVQPDDMTAVVIKCVGAPAAAAGRA